MDKTIDKIAWIRLENRRILAVRSHGKDTFYLPGGKREPGESDEEALLRELEEELSIRIIGSSVQPYGVFEAQAHGKPEGTMVKMSCYTGDYEGKLEPAAEIAEMAWLTSRDRERVSVVNLLIFDRLQQEGLLD